MMNLTVHRPIRRGTKETRQTFGNHHTRRIRIIDGYGANEFEVVGRFEFLKLEEDGKTVWGIKFVEKLNTKRVWICNDRFSKLRDAKETVERNLYKIADSTEILTQDMFWEIEEHRVINGVIDGLLVFKNKGREQFKLEQTNQERK